MIEFPGGWEMKVMVGLVMHMSRVWAGAQTGRAARHLTHR